MGVSGASLAATPFKFPPAGPSSPHAILSSMSFLYKYIIISIVYANLHIKEHTMTTYIFTSPGTSTTFQAANINQAQDIARKLVAAFECPRELCKLTIAASQRTNRVPKDPQGPHTNIPIMLNGSWFTPNGQPIFDITAYKARCRQSAAK